MKLSILCPPNSFLEDLKPELEELGHDILWNEFHPQCDFFIGTSISVQDAIRQINSAFPQVPMINYHWDLYGWHLENPREGEYDWQNYKKLLEKSIEWWTPSKVTLKRTRDLFGLNNGFVMKCFTRLFDGEVSDKDYVLNPWRKMPDPASGWTEKACQELNIPIKCPNHDLPRQAFEKVVREASIIVSDHAEASTGSMTMVEGLYLGKPLLANGSPYSAAHEYLGEFATYFYGYTDLKNKLDDLWEIRMKPDKQKAKEFVLKNYTAKTMAKAIDTRLWILKNRREK